MITDEQVNAFINSFELNGGHFLGNNEFDNVRKALEAYEQSKLKPEPFRHIDINGILTPVYVEPPTREPKPEPYGYVIADSSNPIDIWLPDALSKSAKESGRWKPLYTTQPTRAPYTGERIICAAIMNPSLGVFCGFRHNNCINQSGKYHYRTHDDELWKQGFITTDNGRFVDRAEAWVIADKAGQIINRGEGIDGLLFSENLY
jgi:hypothetical protein